MKWQEEGIILSARRHGESSAVLALLTRERGRHGGIIKVSSRNRSILQPGNFVQANWSARLPEHLGSFQIELIQSPIARIIADPLRLMTMTALVNLLDRLIAERHPYPLIYEATGEFLRKLADKEGQWLRDYALLELKLLEILGYGLDLSRCVATGSLESLVYVSPKSGCAISQHAGLPYASKLFDLPRFILDKTDEIVPLADVVKSLQMSGYFLAKHFFNERLPDHRSRLFQALRGGLSENLTGSKKYD